MADSREDAWVPTTPKVPRYPLICTYLPYLKVPKVGRQEVAAHLHRAAERGRQLTTSVTSSLPLPYLIHLGDVVVHFSGPCWPRRASPNQPEVTGTQVL